MQRPSMYTVHTGIFKWCYSNGFAYIFWVPVFDKRFKYDMVKYSTLTSCISITYRYKWTSLHLSESGMMNFFTAIFCKQPADRATVGQQIHRFFDELCYDVFVAKHDVRPTLKMDKWELSFSLSCT